MRTRVYVDGFNLLASDRCQPLRSERREIL